MGANTRPLVCVSYQSHGDGLQHHQAKQRRCVSLSFSKFLALRVDDGTPHFSPSLCLAAVAAGVPNGTYCPPGQYWDGLAFPDQRSRKHLECFVDTSLSLLSLRLHRINITLVPPKFPDVKFGMVWELISRHINYTIPPGTPLHHYCSGDNIDMHCDLTECEVTANTGCTDVVYECNHCHCYSRACVGVCWRGLCCWLVVV